MKRALSRTDFNSSRLIRFLADVSVVDTAEHKQAFAERLGEWLNVSDAITLHAAHHARPEFQESSLTGHGKPRSPSTASIEADLARTRTALVNSIASSCSPDAVEVRIRLPMPKPGTTIEAAAAYEPYLRFYLAYQGEMDAGVRPLRNRVRKAISKASATLARLATLDAALEKVLGARERQLLSTVPLLLEKRFDQLREDHQQRLANSAQEDDPGLWMQPGEWLDTFCKELQGALLAELELRLQPTIGLMEALSNKVNTH